MKTQKRVLRTWPCVLFVGALIVALGYLFACVQMAMPGRF